MSKAEQQRLREERQEQVRQEQAVKEQARLRVPESERIRLREEREEQERQYLKDREEEMEEYLAWREENKFKPNPEMWKILAMQESARLQERERIGHYDDEEDVEHEEVDLMDMPLRNMNDLQIENYVKRIGRCLRDECDELTMVYNGGDILRYSYCKFIQWGIEDQIVSNITITRAIFNEITFTNYVFDNVTFDECVFKDIILNNTTFKNSKFIECELDSSMVPDKSCEIINYSDDDDHIHIRYY